MNKKKSRIIIDMLEKNTLMKYDFPLRGWRKMISALPIKWSKIFITDEDIAKCDSKNGWKCFHRYVQKNTFEWSCNKFD